MTPAEEDALYAKFWLNLKESDPIRIVIRAAYAKGREDGIAHERERAAAGVDFQFRDLRAKAGTDRRRQAGWDAAQGLLGHAEPGTTKRYIRARDGEAVDPVEFGTSAETNGTGKPVDAS